MALVVDSGVHVDYIPGFSRYGRISCGYNYGRTTNGNGAYNDHAERTLEHE